MMNDEKFDRIENYLDDQLDETQFLDFEKDLMDDLDLEMELNLHKEIDEAIMEDDVMELRSKLEAIDIPSTPIRRRKVKYSSKWRIAAASMIILFGLASAYFMIGNKTYTNEDIFMSYYKPYSSLIINTRSTLESDEVDQVVEEALQSYQSKNYRTALSLFQTILDKDSSNLTGNFYSGISNIQVREYLKANKNFIEVLKHKNNLFIEQSEWYLGICYLMTDQEEKAKQTYKEIANGNSFYSNKAKEILNKLE